MLCAIGIAVATPTVVPTVRLTNGVLPGALIDMPILAAGTAGYKGSNATAAVAAGYGGSVCAADVRPEAGE